MKVMYWSISYILFLTVKSGIVLNIIFLLMKNFIPAYKVLGHIYRLLP